MPFTLVVWSARPIQPLMRMLVRPLQGAGGQHGRQVAGGEADHRVVAVEGGDDHLADLASGTGSPVPGRTISTITSSTIMPSSAWLS